MTQDLIIFNADQLEDEDLDETLCMYCYQRRADCSCGTTSREEEPNYGDDTKNTSDCSIRLDR